MRRELEEVLALVASDVRRDTDTGIHKSLPAPETIESVPIEPREVSLPTEPDNLFDDALVVMTKFGKATPAVLQMWLSIDYPRATRILSDFEAQGLVSSKGRVRHKAYDLRRSRSLESGARSFRL